MRKVGLWMLDVGRLGDIVLLICVSLVEKVVKSCVETIKSYTQNPQTIVFIVKNQKLIPKLHTSFEHILHTYFVRCLSVKSGFYTHSTVPITTTNYLIKKGL